MNQTIPGVSSKKYTVPVEQMSCRLIKYGEMYGGV